MIAAGDTGRVIRPIGWAGVRVRVTGRTAQGLLKVVSLGRYINGKKVVACNQTTVIDSRGFLPDA